MSLYVTHPLHKSLNTQTHGRICTTFLLGFSMFSFCNVSDSSHAAIKPSYIDLLHHTNKKGKQDKCLILNCNFIHIKYLKVRFFVVC